MYVCMNVCMYMTAEKMQTVHIYIYVYIYMYIYICMYVCMYVYDGGEDADCLA